MPCIFAVHDAAAKSRANEMKCGPTQRAEVVLCIWLAVQTVLVGENIGTHYFHNLLYDKPASPRSSAEIYSLAKK